MKYFVINVPDVPTGDIDLSSATDNQIANFALGDQVELRFGGQAFTGTVTCPQGWTYQKRTVNNEEHYILVKSEGQNFITKSENANCYMVNMNGRTTYLTFPLEQATLGWTKIGGQIPDFTQLNCKIKTLWKTWSGTASVTGNISSDKATATLTIPRTVKNGNNAVVALVSENEQTVYWSWHLWFTDYDPSKSTDAERKGQIHRYSSGAKYMMDRNLGATITGITGAINPPTSTAEAVKYYGLYYQWGRKDPFVGSADGTNYTKVRLYNAQGGTYTQDTNDGATTLANSVQKPGTFFTNSSSPNDWLSPQDGDLWSGQTASVSKSVFDPCPPGWRVPKGGSDANNPWSGFSTSNFENINLSLTVVNAMGGRKYSGNNVQAWYPVSGYLSIDKGVLNGVGIFGYYWNASPNNQVSYSLGFYSDNIVPNNESSRASGVPVRCIQE